MTGAPAPVLALRDALHAALVAESSPEQKRSADAYFKGALPFLGVKGPAVDAVFKGSKAARAALTASERLALGALLLGESELAEVRHLGILTLSAEVKRLPPGWLEAIEPTLERQCTNWGTADAMAGRVLRYRLPDAADRARMVTWATSSSPWLRRMACVAYVNEAHKGLYADEIRVVVPAALALDHRFSQLGAGWLLRNRWLAAPAEVEAFLWRERGNMRREALRYAIEKMPPGLQAAFLSGPAPS